jgi:hypothetical protein
MSECHPLAIYNRTPSTRILLIQGQRIEFRYRYEGWVQLVCRRPAPRVDLAILTDELNSEERSGGLWKFDGVAEITPWLYLADAPESSIPADVIREKVVRHLRSSPPAWDRYD